MEKLSISDQYEKKLYLNYGNTLKLISSIKSSLNKYYQVKDKTPKVLERIKNYEELLNYARKVNFKPNYRIELRVMWMRENPNKKVEDHVAEYADWLEKRIEKEMISKEKQSSYTQVTPVNSDQT